MTKTLKTLIKIADKKLEDQQKDIATINAAIDGAQQKQKELAETARKGLRQANVADDITMMQQAGSFAQRAKNEIEELAQALVMMFQKRDELQTVLRGLFAEKKRYEKIKERKDAEQAKDLAKKQQRELDDMAGSR